ncbi:MAG: hypothetical protein ACREEB_18115 [Caulobacteraceae bacterium]
MKTFLQSILGAAMLIGPPVGSAAAAPAKSPPAKIGPIACVKNSKPYYEARVAIAQLAPDQPNRITVQISSPFAVLGSHPGQKLFSAKAIYYRPNRYCVDAIAGQIDLGLLSPRGAVVTFKIASNLRYSYFPNPTIGVRKGRGPFVPPIQAGAWPASWPSPSVQAAMYPYVLTVRFPYAKATARIPQTYTYVVQLRDGPRLILRPGIINH